LLILLCVLFVPIRYRAYGSYSDSNGDSNGNSNIEKSKLELSARVTYLLRIVSAEYNYKKGGLTIKLFGIKLKSLDKESKERNKKYDEDTKKFEKMSKEFNEKRKEISEEFEDFEKNLQGKKEDIFIADIDTDDGDIEGFKKEFSKDSQNEEIDFSDNEDINYPDKDKVNDNTDKESVENSAENKDIVEKIFEKIGFVFSKIFGIIKKIFGLPAAIIRAIIKIKEKIKYIFNKICAIIRKVFSGYETFRDFIDDKENRKTIKHIWNQIKYLLKKIKPKKIKGYLHFGFEDPATTGKALGAIYTVTRGDIKNFPVKAEFEKEIKEGEADIRGYVQLYIFLIILIKLYRDENLMKLIKDRRKHG